jgi:porphobilinogen synthase
MVALFPFTNKKNKNFFGDEALNEENLVCKAIKYIKKKLYRSQVGSNVGKMWYW